MNAAWSWVIVGLLGGGVWLLGLALASAASRGDRMSERWVERYQLRDGRSVITFPPDTTSEQFETFRERWKATHPPLPLYDQDEEA